MLSGDGAIVAALPPSTSAADLADGEEERERGDAGLRSRWKQ